MSRYQANKPLEYDLMRDEELDWRGASPTFTKRMLVIDDESKIRDNYYRIFSRESLEVLTASNAIEANKLLVQEGIDIVLLDINMVEVGGPVLFEVMRAFHRNAKIVVSSVYPVDEQMEMIKDADAYFDKSDSVHVLLEIVSSLLEDSSPLKKKMLMSHASTKRK